MDTTVMRMLKNGFNKCRVSLVKLAKAYDLLRDRMLVIRKKCFCKGGSIRLFCPFVRQPKRVERLCYRCGNPRLYKDASLCLYLFK